MTVDTAPSRRPRSPRDGAPSRVRPAPGVVAFLVGMHVGDVADLMRDIDSLGMEGVVPYLTEVEPQGPVATARAVIRVESARAFLRVDAVIRDRWCVIGCERCD